MTGFLRRLAATALLGASALGALAGTADAVPLDFIRATSNSSADASDQFIVDVTDGATGALVSFGVATGSNPNANIHEIYFSDLGGLFTPALQFVSKLGNVVFTLGSANPSFPPGVSGFTVSPGLLAEWTAGPGGANRGITTGENLTLRLNYASGVDFDDVLASIGSGQFRVAMHVGSLLNGQSDSFVSVPPEQTPAPVPLPAAGVLLLASLGTLAAVRRRRS